MTNLSGSSEDSGVSTVHKTNFGTMEEEKFFAENGRRQFQESPPDSPLTNGWHMDEDANMSFEFSTPMKKSSFKRKLSLDSNDSASAMKKSKLAMTLLEGGKHGVIDGRWVCGECGKTLSSASGLDQHLSTVHGEYKFPCDFCSLMFKRRDHATNHMKRVHQCTKTCTKCSAQFIGREAYAEHMKIVHKIKLTYKTMRKDNEKRSIKKASPMSTTPTTPTMMTPKKKIDEKSPKFSKNGKRLGRPRKSNSPVKNETSTAKTEQVTDINEDTLEMPPPSRTLSFECKFCGRRFHNELKLLQHQRNMHPEEFVMLPCNLCRRWFKGATALREHKEQHHKFALTSELSVFRCSYCSAAFHSEFALEAHIRFFHAEEECLCCGSIFSGAFEMYEHISEVHPPILTPFGYQCSVSGRIFEQRHHAIEYFRRRYVYHWPYISGSRQVFPCPHCQLSFDSWEEMHQHVIEEHGSYGFYYCEPDYVAIAYPGHPDELEMLPCPVCNDFYHDQISLDKHIANDHEPFATRRPFNTRQVTFELENIDYAAEEVEDDLSADNFETSPKPRKQRRIAPPKPKSRQRKLSSDKKPKSKRIRTPSPPPVKLVRSQVKKIIIPKKRTLKKRALQEEKRKQRMQEENGITENEKKKTPPTKMGDTTVISKANIITSRSRTRQAKLPTKQLPQRTPAAASRTRSRSTSSTSKAEQSVKRRGRSSTLKEETSEEDSDEDEDEVDEEPKQEEKRPVSRVGRPRKGASQPTQAKKKVEAKQPSVIPLRRRYLIKDDDDIFDDSDEEIMPTPKRRGDLNPKKKETSESSSEEEESDQSEVEKVEPKKPRVSRPGITKKTPPVRKVQEKWEVAQESDKEEEDDDDEDVPISQTIKSKDKAGKINEQDDEDSQGDEEASDDDDDEEGEEEESDDDEEEGEEDEEESSEDEEVDQPLNHRQKLQQKSRLYEYANEDFDDLMEMVPKVTVRKMEKSVIDRICGYLSSSDESESEDEEVVENGVVETNCTENNVANKQTTKDSLDPDESKQKIVEKEEAGNQTIHGSNHQIKPTENLENQTLKPDLAIVAKINEHPKDHDDQIKNMKTTGNSLDLNEPKQNKEEAVKQTIPDSNHQIKLTETVEKQTLNTDLVLDAKINEQPKEHDAHMVVDENLSKNIENHVNGSSGSMQLLNGHCDEGSISSTELSYDANNVVDKLKNSLQNGDYKEASPPPCLLPNGEKANGNSHLPNSEPLTLGSLVSLSMKADDDF